MIPQGPTDRELAATTLEIVARLALWTLAVAALLVAGLLLIGDAP